MPEFAINGKTDPSFTDLPKFTQGYIEAAFFTSQDDIGDKGFSDVSKDALKQIVELCSGFAAANQADIDLLTDDGGPDGGYDEMAAGRDLWFTSNGHGVGYWDRGFSGEAAEAAERLTSASAELGQADLYLSDDDQISLSP
jgi:hypothetical protein